jgi:hypothetical protein
LLDQILSQICRTRHTAANKNMAFLYTVS